MSSPHRNEMSKTYPETLENDPKCATFKDEDKDVFETSSEQDCMEYERSGEAGMDYYDELSREVFKCFLHNVQLTFCFTWSVRRGHVYFSATFDQGGGGRSAAAYASF